MKEIITPWGEIRPSVLIFPVYYLLLIYGVFYFLPFDYNTIRMYIPWPHYHNPIQISCDQGEKKNSNPSVLKLKIQKIKPINIHCHLYPF